MGKSKRPRRPRKPEIAAENPAAERPRMGRPPLPNFERRDERIMVRLTGGESDLLAIVAGRQGTTPSLWAANAVVRALKRMSVGSLTLTKEERAGLVEAQERRAR